MDNILTYAPVLWQGALMTLQLWLLSSVLSLSIGIILGIFTSNKIWFPAISSFISSALFVLRAIPFYVQLLIVYFVLPAAFGVSLSAFRAGIIALGICSGSYMSNIVRAGINAIPAGQWEACTVLGFSHVNALLYVILPQMIRIMLPAIFNELESVLKSSSIISSIGVLELTRMGMNIVSREMNPIPIYCAIALIYLLLSCVLHYISRLLEKRMNHF